MSYGRARRVLERLPVPWCDWSALVGGSEPIALGVDEHSFRGSDLAITISCLSTHRLVAILPDQRQASLRSSCGRCPSRSVRGWSGCAST